MLRVKKYKTEDGLLVNSLWNGFKSLSGKRFVSVEGAGAKCELKVVNNSEYDIIECWVQSNGMLRNFHQINNNSIRDGSSPNYSATSSYEGHAFVYFKRNNKRPKTILDIKPEVRLYTFLYSIIIDIYDFRNLFVFTRLGLV